MYMNTITYSGIHFKDIVQGISVELKSSFNYTYSDQLKQEKENDTVSVLSYYKPAFRMIFIYCKHGNVLIFERFPILPTASIVTLISDSF